LLAAIWFQWLKSTAETADYSLDVIAEQYDTVHRLSTSSAACYETSSESKTLVNRVAEWAFPLAGIQSASSQARLEGNTENLWTLSAFSFFDFGFYWKDKCRPGNWTAILTPGPMGAVTRFFVPYVE
jgi:hypothetical protein